MDDQTPMSRDEIETLVEDAASRAAQKALHDLFVKLGINVGDTNALIEMQADNRFVRDLRLGSRNWRNTGVVAVITGMVTAAGALLMLGMQAMFGGPHGG